MKVYLFFVLILLVAFAPILFLNRMFIDSDLTYYFYPTYHAYSQAIQSGENFLWNSTLFSGFPTYVSQSGGLLDPVNYFIFSFFDYASGSHLRLLLDYFLVLASSYLAGLALGLSPVASALIGFGYLLGLSRTNVTNPAVANSLFLLPFLIFIIVKISQSSSRRLWLAAAGGLGIGWSLLAGNAQFILYTFLVVGTFSIFLAWHLSKKREFFLDLGLMLAFGLLIGLPQILPTTRFVSLTARAGGLSYADAVNKVVELNSLTNLVLPDYLYLPYLGVGRKGLYIGFFWLVMMLASFFYLSRDRLMKFFAIMLGLIFLASIKYSPIFYLLHQLPAFKLFRSPSRWMYLGVFFMSLLAAYGFDQVIREGLPKKARWLWYVGGIFLGLGAMTVLIFNFFGNFLKPAALSLLATFPLTARYKFFSGAYDVFQRTVVLTNIDFLVPVLVIVASLVLIVFFRRGKLNSEQFKKLGATLSVLTFVSVFWVQTTRTVSAKLPKLGLTTETWRSYPFFPSKDRLNVFSSRFVYPIEELKAQFEFNLAGGTPNLHALYGIDSVDGYDLMVDRRYIKILTALGSDYGAQDQTVGLTVAERMQKLDEFSSLLGMMGGKYVFSGYQIDSPNFVLMKKYVGQDQRAFMYIYENKKALPKIYFAQSVSFAAFDSKNDFAKTTFIECDDCSVFNKIDEEAILNEIETRDGLFTIETASPTDNWLVISESFLPGWRASIDGIDAPIYRANDLYMAILVPAGEHRITLQYDGVLGEARILRKLGIIKY